MYSFLTCNVLFKCDDLLQHCFFHAASGPTLPMLLCFGESFSAHGRLFLISGHSGTNWDNHDIGLELVNDATEWVNRTDMARKGANWPGFIYNDKESRWLQNGELLAKFFF